MRGDGEERHGVEAMEKRRAMLRRRESPVRGHSSPYTKIAVCLSVYTLLIVGEQSRGNEGSRSNLIIAREEIERP